jgi:hypothetical protein
VLLGLDELRPIAILEEVAFERVPFIERHRMHGVQFSHPNRQTLGCAPEEQVVVVGQEAVRETAPAVSQGSLAEEAHEEGTIAVIHEDRATAVAARGYVVDRVWFERAWTARHKATVDRESRRPAR